MRFVVYICFQYRKVIMQIIEITAVVYAVHILTFIFHKEIKYWAGY